MKLRVFSRWIPLSGVMGAGILVGLIVAGVWDATPVGITSDLAIEALSDPQTISTTSTAHVSNVLPDATALLEESDWSVTASTQQGELPSLRGAAAAVRPAVVSVQVVRWREGRPRGFRYTMPEIPEQYRDLFPRFDQPSPDEEQTPERDRVRGEGSGFIFSKDGYIITNNHVIEGATDVTVVLPDKRSFNAEIVGADEITDVAVIKIKADEDLPTVVLGDSDSIEIGDWVLAVGNPLEFDYTVTAGIVSAKGRSLNLGPVDERGARTAI